MAFLLLNRFLDIFEVIDDPENNGNLADLGEFQYTDIPSPFDVALPDQNLISEKDKQNLSKINKFILYSYRRLAASNIHRSKG